MADALGEICLRSGLTKSNLRDRFIQDSSVIITNGIILELRDKVDRSLLVEHFGTSMKALFSKVKRLKDNRRNLQKAANYDNKHKAQFDNFLKEKFCLPKTQLHVPVESNPKPLCQNC